MPSDYAKDIASIRDNVATLLERSTNTLDQLKKLNGTVTALDDQVDTNCQDIAKLQERQGVLAGIGTGLTLFVGAVAAWIGSQR